MGLTTCAKGCIACGVGTAVVLAIMIPVSILVIAPSMGQHALDVSVMNIPNSTVYGLPDNLHLDHTAKISNTVSLKQTSMPFGAKLHETQMVMHVPASEPGGFFAWPSHNLAWFTMPEMDIKHGDNTFDIATDITVLENTDYFTYWAFTLTFGTPYGTTVHIVGQPKLSALGIFHMDLKLGKRMNCSYVPETTTTAPPSPSEEESITARRLAGVGGMGPVTLRCIDEGEMDGDLIDEVLQNFSQDLARTTTTTAAPTTAPPSVV